MRGYRPYVHSLRSWTYVDSVQQAGLRPLRFPAESSAFRLTKLESMGATLLAQAL